MYNEAKFLLLLGVQVVELSNTKSGDEEDFQQCLDKCCTCSTENIKNDTTIREPPTETLSVSTSGPTSCYCSTQTSTGNTTYERSTTFKIKSYDLK